MNNLPEMNATDIDTGLWRILRDVKTRTFADIRKRQLVLRLITEMRLSKHPSGYPDPAEISMLTRFIRDEKFRIVREQGRDDPSAAEIQHLIDVLKQLEAAARQVRPVCVSQLPWYRAWAGLPGMIVMLISPAFSAFVIYQPPDLANWLALFVYVLLTAAAGSLSQDKFAPLFATLTMKVLVVAHIGMALHFVYTTVYRLSNIQ